MIGKIIILSLLFLGFSLTPVFALTPNESIHFDDSDNANFIFKGSKKITNQENSSYNPSGFGDFLILTPNLPDKLNDFTISVWVKPEYKIGTSTKLSIVSNSNSFDLSINNDKVEKNVAIFSIFDGIRWHVVKSKTAIPQEWTHITATYSKNEIKIFANGAQEGSVRIDGDYSQTHQYGVSNQNSNDFIYSNSKFLIGAFDPSIRSIGKIKNYFSGEIDDLLLFNTNLSKDQIYTIFQNERISYTPNIQAIEAPILKITSTPNQYGFISDPNDLNDQNIETLSYVGFKIQKSLSEKNHSLEINNHYTISEITTNNQSPNEEINSITEEGTQNGNKKQSIIENTKTSENSVSITSLCHISANGVENTLTFPTDSMSLFFHLNHGDKVGKCT